jgi:hypothetical protein
MLQPAELGKGTSHTGLIPYVPARIAPSVLLARTPIQETAELGIDWEAQLVRSFHCFCLKPYAACIRLAERPVQPRSAFQEHD